MAINDVHLISKQGTSPPTTVSLDVGAIAANLSFLDRHLKKAGLPELRRFFESDGESWLQTSEVLIAFEKARAFFNDDALDEILFEVVAEQLGPANKILRKLPKNSLIRLEVIQSKPRKPAKPKSARSGSSVQAAAATAAKAKSPKRPSGAAKKGAAKPIQSQLTAKQREYVQSLLERYRCDADLWAVPDIERKARIAQIDQRSGLNSLECLRRNLRQQQPQLNDEECEALVEMSLFSTIDLPERGLARRIAFNLLSDLRTALSMEARIDWLEHRRYRSKGGSDSDAGPILRALAARDVAIARRFLDLSDGPLRGRRGYGILLYNAMLAIFRRDEALQRDLVGPIAKQKAPEAYKAILNVLGGILTEDASVVAAGLTQVLATFRRMPAHDHDKIISFLAHGLAELALEKNGKLLDEFDVAQGMPWDAAFFEWLRGESSSPVYPELAKKSPLLDKWLNRFEIPDSWGKDDEDDE